MAHSVPFQFGANDAQPTQPNTSQNTAQNASLMPQQPSTQQNASIPALPANLAALLQGVSPQQLMGILQAFQSGQLPGLAPGPATPASNVSPQQPPPATASVVQPSAPVDQDVDMDKEEGELEEAQELGVPRQSEGFASRPGLSIRSASPRDPYSRGQVNKRDRRPRNAGSPRQVTSQRSSVQRDASPVGNNGQATSRRNTGNSARNFVLQLHNAGYTFDDLADKVNNKNALRRMYKTLNLPLAAEAKMNGGAVLPPLPAQVDGATATHPKPTAEERRPSATKRPPPPARPALPTDRAEYLAKLAAARTSRNKPPGGSATNQPSKTSVQSNSQNGMQTSVLGAPAASLPTPAALLAPKAPALAPAAPITPTSNTSRPNAQPGGRSVIQTELIKQRLEALKAEQAAKKLAAQQSGSDAANSSPAAKPPSHIRTHPAAQKPVAGGLGAGLANVARDVVPAMPSATHSTSMFAPPIQPSYSPFPTPGRSFGSLPGLFMASTPVQSKMQAPQAPRLVNSAANGASMTQLTTTTNTNQAALPRPAASSTSSNASEKRAAASAFDEDYSARGRDASQKRPIFGQSRSNSDSERVVIEVSDNEDDEDMEIDAAPAQPALYGTARGSMSLPGLQQRLSGSGAPSSPQVATDMDLRIAELKRKIAEKEANKAQSKSGGMRPATSTSASGQATPSLNAITTRDQVQESRMVATQQILRATGQPPSTTAVANTARKQEMNQLSQRLQELQEQVARHDGISLSASPIPVKQQSPPGKPTTALQPAVQSTSSVPEPVPEMYGNENRVAQDGNVASAALSTYIDKALNDTTERGDEDQIDSQATTVSEVPRLGSGAVDTESAAADLPSNEVEILQAASAVMSAPESINDDVEMEEDSSDDDESDSDEDSDDSLNGTSIAGAEYDVASDTVLPDLESRTQVHPAVESSLQSSTMDTEAEAQQALQSQASLVEEGEVDVDDEEYDPTDMDIVPTAEPVDHSEAVVAADDSSLLVTDQGRITDDHVAPAEDAMNVDAVVQPTIVDAQASIAPTVSDDLAPELQLAVTDQVAVENQDAVDEIKLYYRPYESALIHFKDYRYHPDFLQQVSNGYKSLTYSHRIDPVQPLCPTEAAGNICRDLKCPNQHFRTMGLTDNQLLKLLGTHRTPTTNLEDKQRWNKGLSDLVQHLRTTSASKDANAIATNIAQYRRDFVGDESSVLFLG